MNKIEYNAIDIAKWFINHNLKVRDIDNEDTDDISNLKLQKLLYYAQGSMLALTGKKLFNDEILAWAHGPVIKEVYDTFKSYGSSGINEYFEDNNIDIETENILKQVYNEFGKYSAWGLRDMTHNEIPWIETRRNDVISITKIYDYFKEHYVE